MKQSFVCLVHITPKIFKLLLFVYRLKKIFVVFFLLYVLRKLLISAAGTQSHVTDSVLD